MTNLSLLVGLIGLTCLSLSGVPHLIKAIKEGHSDGLALGTIWFWIIGEFSYIVYGLLIAADRIIMLNYVFNFAIVAVIAYYKHFPKRFPKHFPKRGHTLPAARV